MVYHLLPAMYSTLAYRVPTKLYSVRQVENGKPLNDKFNLWYDWTTRYFLKTCTEDFPSLTYILDLGERMSKLSYPVANIEMWLCVESLLVVATR